MWSSSNQKEESAQAVKCSFLCENFDLRCARTGASCHGKILSPAHVFLILPAAHHTVALLYRRGGKYSHRLKRQFSPCLPVSFHLAAMCLSHREPAVCVTERTCLL